MVRRITNPAIQVETVFWPGRSGVPGASGPPLLPAGHGGQQSHGKNDAQGGDTAEWERRLAEVERLRQLDKAEAHHRGVEDGLRRGREEAAAEVKKAFDQVAHALDQLAQVKRKLLTTDPASIEGIVHAALQKLQQREASKVRVYPAGVAAVRAALDRIGSRSGIEIVSDPGLATGAILFETAVGELDASIETQLLEIQRGFADRLGTK